MTSAVPVKENEIVYTARTKHWETVSKEAGP